MNGATGLAVGLGVGTGVGGADDSEGLGVRGSDVSGFDMTEGLVVLVEDGSEGFGIGGGEDGLSVGLLTVMEGGLGPVGFVVVDDEALEITGETLPDLF